MITKKINDIFQTIEFLKTCNQDSLLLNSCFNEKGTIIYVLEDSIHNFEFITGIYLEHSDVIADFSFDSKYNLKEKCISVKEFLDKVKDFKFTTYSELIRDVEDGFKFSGYGNVLSTDEYVIFY